MEGVQGRQGALSRREMEVAALVAEGLTNRAIAERMFIAERTVDGHLEHIREKLGVNSRTQVATWFVAQSQPTVSVPAAQPATRRSVRPSWLLPTAAVAVVALVAGAILYERMTPPSSPGPAVTLFTSKDPVDQMRLPWSLAVDHDGAVYVADSSNTKIRKIDPKAGSIITYAGRSAPRDFVEGSDRLQAFIGFVTGVALSPDGSALYFANQYFVGRVDADSTVHFVTGNAFNSSPTNPLNDPVGLAVAPDGTLYIADLLGNRVWKRTASGELAVFAGTGDEGFAGDGGPASDAKLDRPRALALEPDGDLLIADTDNNRIREVLHGSNVILTIAGSGDYYGFSGDGGRASLARLSLPWGVAVGRDGTIYVADTGNSRVRSINARGVISTLVSANFIAPAGVALSADGGLYVVDLADPWLHEVHLAAGASPA
jgi:DNA-binding CsgD family transcriptional regulator/DNA-binding beta-propeller fold protein YncE